MVFIINVVDFTLCLHNVQTILCRNRKRIMCIADNMLIKTMVYFVSVFAGLINRGNQWIITHLKRREERSF